MIKNIKKGIYLTYFLKFISLFPVKSIIIILFKQHDKIFAWIILTTLKKKYMNI